MTHLRSPVVSILLVAGSGVVITSIYAEEA